MLNLLSLNIFPLHKQSSFILCLSQSTNSQNAYVSSSAQYSNLGEQYQCVDYQREIKGTTIGWESINTLGQVESDLLVNETWAVSHCVCFHEHCERLWGFDTLKSDLRWTIYHGRFYLWQLSAGCMLGKKQDSASLGSIACGWPVVCLSNGRSLQEQSIITQRFVVPQKFKQWEVVYSELLL